MTNEQIEIERVSFEKFRRNELPQISLSRDKDGEYENICCYVAFKYWLAAKQDSAEQRSELEEHF